ncbi:hypothetical protein F3D3_0701 [Fusibacter sp. 3D3]|nr:hypothetical protein F3D3_0701 [Fusibacter sp. 3D3]
MISYAFASFFDDGGFASTFNSFQLTPIGAKMLIDCVFYGITIVLDA